MKHLLILIYNLTSLNATSQLKKWVFISDIAPIISYKSNFDLVNGNDSVNIHNIGISISLADGDLDITDWGGLPIITTWNYFSAPFIGLEYNVANTIGETQLYKAIDGASALMLNLGVTGGIGGSLLIFPLGINGTLGVSTDFKDLYTKYGIAFDMWGFSIGYSGFLNLTKNNDSFYKTTPGVGFRYIWNWK